MMNSDLIEEIESLPQATWERGSDSIPCRVMDATMTVCWFLVGDTWRSKAVPSDQIKLKES